MWSGCYVVVLLGMSGLEILFSEFFFGSFPASLIDPLSDQGAKPGMHILELDR